MLRADVEEREYSVAARIRTEDEEGEELPKSDRLATAFHVAQEAERRSGYPATVVEDENGIAAIVELGDASERAFEEAAGILLEVAEW